MKMLYATAAFALLAGPALATDEDMITFECPPGTFAQVDQDHGHGNDLDLTGARNGERSASAADRDRGGDSQREYTPPSDNERNVGTPDRDRGGDSQREYTDPGDGDHTVGGGQMVRCVSTSAQR